MLKLVTQPRSRRKREWWRATPGRSGACSVPPPPAEGPADRDERGVSRIVFFFLCLAYDAPGRKRLKLLAFFFVVRSRLLGFGPGGYPSHAYFASHAN